MLCLIRCAKTTPDDIPLILIVTGDFVDMYESLEQAAQPFLGLLKQGGHIPRNQHFTAFTPDVTRFILKQHEKSRSDSPQEGVYSNMLGQSTQGTPATLGHFYNALIVFSVNVPVMIDGHLRNVEREQRIGAKRDAMCTARDHSNTRLFI